MRLLYPELIYISYFNWRVHAQNKHWCKVMLRQYLFYRITTIEKGVDMDITRDDAPPFLILLSEIITSVSWSLSIF